MAPAYLEHTAQVLDHLRRCSGGECLHGAASERTLLTTWWHKVLENATCHHRDRRQRPAQAAKLSK